MAPLAGRLTTGSEALTAMAPPDGGWRKAKRKEPDASQQTDPSPTASRAAKSRARTAAAGKVLDPDDYRDEVLSEIDPRSLAQARDALIVQTDRCHRLRSEKDEALAEAMRLESELDQTRAQWKHAMDAHGEASTAVRDLRREVDHLREELATERSRRDADAAELDKARALILNARDAREAAERDARDARDEAAAARDAASRAATELTQSESAVAKTSREFEAAAVAELAALKERNGALTRQATEANARAERLESDLRETRAQLAEVSRDRDAIDKTLRLERSAAADEAAALAAARDLASTRVDELAASVASAHELRRALADAESRARVVEDRLAKASVRRDRFERRAREAEGFVRSLASSTDAMDAEWRRVRDALARRCEVIEEEAAVDAAQAAAQAAASGRQSREDDPRSSLGRESNGGGGEAAAPSPPRRVATRGGGRKGRAGARGAS